MLTGTGVDINDTTDKGTGADTGGGDRAGSGGVDSVNGVCCCGDDCGERFRTII